MQEGKVTRTRCCRSARCVAGRRHVSPPASRLPKPRVAGSSSVVRLRHLQDFRGISRLFDFRPWSFLARRAAGSGSGGSSSFAGTTGGGRPGRWPIPQD
jgi:hypothetical protein